MSTQEKLARARILSEVNEMRIELWNKEKRLEQLRKHRALPGCEHIAEDARKRYMEEIDDLKRQIDLLEANLEGMNV